MPVAAAVAMGPEWQAHVIAKPADMSVPLAATVAATVNAAPRPDNVQYAPKRLVKKPFNCSITTGNLSARSGCTKSSTPVSRQGSEGRCSKVIMADAAKRELTLQRIEELGANEHCKCKHTCCLYRDNMQARMAMGGNVHTLWGHFNSQDPKFHQGQALLDYMNANEKETDGCKKDVAWRMYAGAPQEICVSCWRICAGYNKPNGIESSLFV
jgi:hypothetical protein